MKSIRLIALMGLVFLSAAPAQAAKNYGSAGCGLGSMVMGKGGNQVLAATTNATSYSQTFGISSGTSNCQSSGNMAMNMKVYVEANHVALANDMARGNGDTVANLAQIVGCKDIGAFATSMQKNYSRIYPSQNADPGEVSSSIITTIRADAKLAETCKKMI